MPGAERQRLAERRRPARFGVAGKRIDQVEADPSEIPLRDFKRAETFARRMGAAEEAQRLIIEALQARAKAG